ncbi:MAG: hypothetical protein RLZZ08_132 [Pseudomonadota bacterium]|jgi:polysaccharide pyruvyl transferase WcaK-like protein
MAEWLADGPPDEESVLLKSSSSRLPEEAAPPDGDQSRGSAAGSPVPTLVAASRPDRPALLICGDLANIGDLALAAQNIALFSAQGTPVTIRCWGPPPASAMAQLCRWGASWIDGRRVVPLLRLAWRSDVVFGGGELIRANASLRALVLMLLAVLAARLGGGQVLLRGLGVGRVRGSRALIWRMILRRASRIAVRDQRSADALRAIWPRTQAVVAADMAFLGNRLVAMARHGSSDPSGAVVIAPCMDASEGRAMDSAVLRELVRQARLAFPGAPLVLACHDPRPGMDRDAAQHLIGKGLRGAVLFDAGGDLARMQALYRDAQLVVTNRLHAGIFAVLHARPLVVVHDGNAKLDLLSADFDIVTVRAGDAEGAATAVDRAKAITAARARARAAMGASSARNVASHRTAIFNVKFSPNLGDGVIAECLEGELQRADPRMDPVSIDLAGRTGFDSTYGRHRKSVLAVLERLPGSLRARVIPAILSPLIRYRHAPRWRRRLQHCSSAIIGGGALFADVDQNFPIKIGEALHQTRGLRLPVAIASVGVSAGWSAMGQQRIAAQVQAANLASLSVRDQQSQDAWNGLFAQSSSLSPQLAPDPGLLSARQYGAVERRGGSSGGLAAGCSAGGAVATAPVAGLCITSPLALRLHHDDSHDDDQLEAWLQVTMVELVQRGCRVCVFTNGSPEDRLFRDRVARHMAAHPDVEFTPDFATPGELARFIAGLDCVLAHRLHACIVAYSYRVPTVGFAWDSKLRAFFQQTARDHFVVDPRETTPMELGDLAFAAMEQGVDAAHHAALLDRATAKIHALAQCLLHAAASPPVGAR